MNPLLKEKVLNFLSVLIYLFFFGISIFFVTKKEVSISHISLTDVGIMILATYRIARMIVYERVFGLFRYWISLYLKYPFVRSLNNLITCPWCTGVWVALAVFDIYYMIPYGNYLIFLFAISAVASPLILLSNIIVLHNDAMKKHRDN